MINAYKFLYFVCITKKPPSDVERRLICCAWTSPSEGNTVVRCRGKDVMATCRIGDVTTRYREGDDAIAYVGKEAAAAASYRGRAAAAMCRRGEVTTKCREGSVVFDEVVITIAWCRGRDVAACVGEGTLPAGAGKAMPMSAMWGKEAITTNGVSRHHTESTLPRKEAATGTM
jgi:hypothetical protein